MSLGFVPGSQPKLILISGMAPGFKDKYFIKLNLNLIKSY